MIYSCSSWEKTFSIQWFLSTGDTSTGQAEGNLQSKGSCNETVAFLACADPTGKDVIAKLDDFFRDAEKVESTVQRAMVSLSVSLR